MEKIALSLVGPIVSPIFSKLENAVLPYFGGDITEEELQHLQNTILPKIKAVLLVAEAKNVDALKPWLVTLKEAAYEAEDVLDMYEYRRLEAQVSSLPNCIKTLKKKARDFAAPFSLKTELKKSMEKLIKIAAGIDPFVPIISNFPNQDPMNQQQQQHAATVSSPTSLVIGRDHERNSIVNMLISANNMPSTSSERRIPVLAIYGIGGAGKTTLAQSIYKDSKIEDHFGTNNMWWVHVSRKFDPHAITKKIIESIKQDECRPMENFDALQSILKNMLKSKKLFLVLDDVWCLESFDKELWDRMLIPFNEVGEVGSRILITCRAEEVTSKLGVNHSFPLAELKDDDYWSIFMHYSTFGDVKKYINDRKLLEVAREIVKKLSKSPLAARMVGSSLWGKEVEYWKQTLQRGDMLKDTLGALYWSFEQLPPYLQRCFALSSLYPKGYLFSNIEDFVRLWIAQGFVEVPSDSTVTIEDEAMRYFNELLSMSFFQRRKYDWYDMHDLLHDLAEKVSKDYCFRIEDDRQRIPRNVMHLSIVGYKDISSHIIDIFKLLNLRTLIIVSWTIGQDDIFGFIQQVFMKFKKLRMLHVGVGYHKAFKLDKSVGGLKLLRYFQIERVKELPESMGKLYHLQFLIINSSIMNKVPHNLNNLINMRYMGKLKPTPYYDDHDVTVSKIPLFGKLTSLQHIDQYEVSSKETQFGIGQLKNLQQLRTLRLYNLKNVKDKAEASEASLEKKKHIDTLELHWLIQWCWSSERDGSMDEEVLQGLQPPPNLGALVLDGYKGVRLPKWTRTDGSLSSDMNFIDLERLHSLEIVDCDNLEQVPSLPRMLRRLVIRGCANLSEVPPFPCHDLEELDLEDCSGVVETMLSNMSLFNCENGSSSSSIQGVGFVLKRFRIVKCSIDGGGEKELCLDKLTSLIDLTFNGLPWLTSVLLGPNLTTSLRFLSVMGCPKLTIKSGGDSLSPSSSSSSLQRVTIDDLSLLTALPRRECCLNSISSLTIQKCTQDKPFTAEQEELFQHLSSRSLTSLKFNSCEGLPSLPANLENLSSLRVLYIWGCPKIESLPNLPASLSNLSISHSPKIESLPNLPASLSNLYIFGCPKIESLPTLPASLSYLYISDCPKIESLPNLPASLSYLNILVCLKIESLPNLPASLSNLNISHSPKIESLPNLPASLSNLYIIGCPKIESLPNLPASLRYLYIIGCPKIESLPNLPASLRTVEIASCHPRLKQKYKNDKKIYFRED